MKHKPKTLQPALFNELVNGLQLLLALRLPGSPAADTIAATATAWEIALTVNKDWDAERDAPRFQTAFGLLAAKAEFWPMPAAFLDALPPPPPLLQLAYHHQKPTAEQIRTKDALIKALTQKLTGKRRRLTKGN